MKHDEFMTQIQYADRIGVNRNHINKLVKIGVIPLHKRKIDPDEADNCVAAYKQERKSLESPISKITISRRIIAAVATIAIKKNICRSKAVLMLLLESKTLNDVLDHT